MIRRILPIVGNALILVYSIGVAKGDGFDVTHTVQLAQSTIDRLITAEGVGKDAKNISVDETQPSRTGEGAANTDSAAEQNTPTAGQSEGEKESTEEDKNLSYDGSELIEWINDNGGFVNPNARIGLDPTGQYRGVFVKNAGEEGGTSEGIEDGDIIARIPWDLIVKPSNYKSRVYKSCEALHEMHRQFLLGDRSEYAPYINYLKNQPRGRIPSEWTDAGKRLLEAILDHETLFDDESGLPPSAVDDFRDIWIDECGGEDTPLARAAYYQFTSRDEDTLMVPFYDMHNHSNDPKKLNTISDKPRKEGKPFLLRSIRDIRPGEQIFLSYNRCNPCWFDENYDDCATKSYYGTSKLFDTFGFVEDFPQSWSYRMDVGEGGREEWDELNFCLGAADDGTLLVTFGNNFSEDLADEMPLEANIKYLGNHLVRLRELESSMKEDNELMQTMPKYEWEMAWRYHGALMTSISAAILASKFADAETADGVFNLDYGSIRDDTRDDSGDYGEIDREDEEDSEDDSSDDSGDDDYEEYIEDEEGKDEL